MKEQKCRFQGVFDVAMPEALSLNGCDGRNVASAKSHSRVRHQEEEAEEQEH